MSADSCRRVKSATLLEAVRALRVADPGLGQKPLLAKLREQQPDLGAGTKEVREAVAALKAESEAKAQAEAAAVAAATAPPANDEGGAPAHAAPSLALRAWVLSGDRGRWELARRSAAELKEAAAHFDRAAALYTAPAMKLGFARNAEFCRRQADAM